MTRLAALALALVCSVAAQAPRPTLGDLFTDDWAKLQPVPDAWPDMSLDALVARETSDRSTLAALHQINRASLPAQQRIGYDLFERELEIRIEQFRVGLHYTPLWSDTRVPLGVWSSAEIARRLESSGSTARLEALPAYLEQLQLLLRRGMEAGLLPSRDIAQTLLLPAGPVGEDRPALRRYENFLLKEYLPKCPDEASLSDWPLGRDAYALLVRRQVGIQIAPQALHAMALAEAARIRAAMLPVVRETGFQGTLAAFQHEVYTDPRYFFSNDLALMEAHRQTAGRIQAQLSKVTHANPLTPMRIEPIRDPLRAAAYGVNGTVMVDISSPALRPRFEVLVVMLHEGAPGHHLQVGQPWNQGADPAEQAMRRTAGYAEGWGLYAESLGYDMGLYSDPYERFGQLSYDLLRSMRVAVDSGVHALGWSRERAVQFVMEQTGRPRALAEAEVKRIANPATQSAYKAGERVFRRLRDRAEAALGADFDLARFHDTILSWGAMPLEILERRFDDCLRDACLNAQP